MKGGTVCCSLDYEQWLNGDPQAYAAHTGCILADVQNTIVTQHGACLGPASDLKFTVS